MLAYQKTLPVYFLQQEGTVREWMTSQHLASLVVKHIGIDIRRKQPPPTYPEEGNGLPLTKRTVIC